jgi:hypothetical protein
MDNKAQRVFDLFVREHEPKRQFFLARACAIEAYALVENSLVSLYAHLMGVPADVAGVSFFRINNSRARLAILERLLKKKHGATHNFFWNSLVKNHLRPLDDLRNQVVHWIVMTNLEYNDQEVRIGGHTLHPPNYWDRTENTPNMSEEELYDFSLKSYFLFRLVAEFVRFLAGREQMPPAWQQIFQQPVAYPPPDIHPLARIA